MDLSLPLGSSNTSVIAMLASKSSMTGTPNQIEWAEKIKPRVGAEFDRVASALMAVSLKQLEPNRAGTLSAIAILDEKRAEVMANNKAGYFIKEWQELDGKVRLMITQDPRYLALKDKQSAKQGGA